MDTSFEKQQHFREVIHRLISLTVPLQSISGWLATVGGVISHAYYSIGYYFMKLIYF